jgi:hypothetical protein
MTVEPNDLTVVWSEERKSKLHVHRRSPFSDIC